MAEMQVETEAQKQALRRYLRWNPCYPELFRSSSGRSQVALMEERDSISVEAFSDKLTNTVSQCKTAEVCHLH